jgi:hypothetical protein
MIFEETSFIVSTGRLVLTACWMDGESITSATSANFYLTERSHIPKESTQYYNCSVELSYHLLLILCPQEKETFLSDTLL